MNTEEAKKQILDHQDKIAAAKQNVDAIKKAIAFHQSKVDDSSLEGTLQKISSRREDVLADMALGQGSSEELKSLDAEIENVSRRNSQIFKDKESSKAALSGLNRKLQEANDALANLRSEDPALKLQYVRKHAEDVCVGYMEAVATLRERYLEMVALDEIVKNQNLASHLIGSYFPDISIPTFPLPPCKGMGIPNTPQVFFDATYLYRMGYVEKAKADTLKSFRDDGITLF